MWPSRESDGSLTGIVLFQRELRKICCKSLIRVSSVLFSLIKVINSSRRERINKSRKNIFVVLTDSLREEMKIVIN